LNFKAQRWVDSSQCVLFDQLGEQFMREIVEPVGMYYLQGPATQETAYAMRYAFLDQMAAKGVKHPNVIFPATISVGENFRLIIKSEKDIEIQGRTYQLVENWHSLSLKT
jgi:hypothetical protein